MRWASALIAGAVLLAATEASAKQFRFVGVHPLVAELGGGFCNIEFAHVHIYEPAVEERVAYRLHNGRYVFVGDPEPDGYAGPKHAYYGPHPIRLRVTARDRDDFDERCHIDGPHFHAFAAPPTVSFKVEGGVHFFIGTMPPVFEAERPNYGRINVLLHRRQYRHPVLVGPPPREYRAPVVYIERPGVSVNIGVGLPGVIAWPGVGAPPPGHRGEHPGKGDDHDRGHDRGHGKKGKDR